MVWRGGGRQILRVEHDIHLLPPWCKDHLAIKTSLAAARRWSLYQGLTVVVPPWGPAWCFRELREWGANSQGVGSRVLKSLRGQPLMNLGAEKISDTNFFFPRGSLFKKMFSSARPFFPREWPSRFFFIFSGPLTRSLMVTPKEQGAEGII